MSTASTHPTHVRLFELYELLWQVDGLQDPLSNAVARANGLRDACSNVEVQLLDAGHCPHDEVPHLVNEGLLRFMNKATSADDSKLVAPELDRKTVTVTWLQLLSLLIVHTQAMHGCKDVHLVLLRLWYVFWTMTGMSHSDLCLLQRARTWYIGTVAGKVNDFFNIFRSTDCDKPLRI